MKHLLYILLTCITLSACQSNDKKKAIAYNDSLVTQQIAVVDAAIRLQEALDTYHRKDMQTLHKEFQGQINASLAKIQAQSDFSGDKKFKDATEQFVKTYKQLAQNQYREAVTLLSKDDSVYSKADEARVKQLFDAIDKTSGQARQEYEREQAAFATRNNVELKNPSTGKK
ncbi:MAG: hypothetical protein ACK5CY_05650 [Bacteroidia bacterium]|jgi:hypothetical protein